LSLLRYPLSRWLVISFTYVGIAMVFFSLPLYYIYGSGKRKVAKIRLFMTKKKKPHRSMGFPCRE